MKKFLKNIFDWFILLLSGKGDIGDWAVSENLVDYSGQGRDKYGR